MECPETSQTCPRLHLDLVLASRNPVGDDRDQFDINQLLNFTTCFRMLAFNVVQGIQCRLIFISLCRLLLSGHVISGPEVLSDEADDSEKASFTLMIRVKIYERKFTLRMLKRQDSISLGS